MLVYIIDKVVFTNTIKLQLPTLIRIYPVVNVSQVVQYREQVGGAESRKSKTSRGRQSQKIESRKKF